MGIGVSLSSSASFSDGVVFVLLVATLAALAWTMLPAIDNSFWSKFHEPHHRWRSFLRNDYQVILTRQQRRALERRPPAEPTTSGGIRRAAIWVWTQTLRLLKILPLWANIVVVLLSVGATIVALYEFFDEAVPYIEPDPAISTSWHDLPFKAKIDSRIFGASDIQVSCNAENITWKTDPKWGLANLNVNVLFKVDRIAEVIPPHVPISFSCNTANVNSLKTVDNQIAPIILIELHVQMRYRSFLWPWGETIIPVPWQREITSERFTWREVSPGSYQWLEGEPRVR